MPIGVICNSMGVLLGGLLGCRLGDRIPERIRHSLPAVLGFVAITMGIIKIVTTQSMLAVTLSVLFGTLIGEALCIDGFFRSRAVKTLKRVDPVRGKEGADLLVLAFVAFCLSGTGIFGALEEGLSGDSSILLSKAALDFITAILFASVAGPSIALLGLAQGAILIVLYLAGGLVAPLLSPATVSNFLSVGGVLTAMNGCAMAEISDIRPANTMPALVLVFILSRLV